MPEQIVTREYLIELADSQVAENPDLATCLYAICGSMGDDSLAPLSAYLSIFVHYRNNVVGRAMGALKESIEMQKLFGGSE